MRLKNLYCVLLIIILVVAPYHSAAGQSQPFQQIIQYVSFGQYEEAIVEVDHWLKQVQVTDEEREVLYMQVRYLLDTLSSSAHTKQYKLFAAWSFTSLAEYIDQDTLSYFSFLSRDLEAASDRYEATKDPEVKKKIDLLYHAMLPTLIAAQEKNDWAHVTELTSSTFIPLLDNNLQGYTYGSVPVLSDIQVQDNFNHSSLWIVAFFVGGIIFTTLLFVSWRNYEGERNRKKIRDRND
ncbi:sporulation protein YpjB [Jeotgalibacillus soli]|uniref:Sporulation protein YpjB n=1 Tax=Jeotgalibacillus soli TaxID=889306 RepID=A0A0C2V594_9BACL|nr:sporulation protein YpjB [Jeotgalibacillus soli]KIL44187.1 hypothetical protein KP78_31510 [Jeotgalibacillus soli]